VRIHEGSNSADIKVGTEGGAEIPLQPVEKTMVRPAVCLQPMEDPTLEQVVVLTDSYDPVGSPHWSRLPVGPVAPWREEPTLEKVC